MKALEREEATTLINNIFPALSINHIDTYEYIFTEPNNPVFKRNTGRIIFKDADVEVTLDIFDNSPSDFSFFKLKIKLHGKLILMQTGEYNNITFTVGLKDTDYYQEDELKSLFFDEIIELD